MHDFLERLKAILFGRPIANDRARGTGMRSRLAIPVYGAGILSAVAYAPDALVSSLSKRELQGAIPWVALGVVGIMVLLAFAYRSNVQEFDSKRGDYGIIRARLGVGAGVVSGAALLVDYVLTVAVSVGALAHIVSFVVPSARGWETLLGVAVIALMTQLNLRGVRERARVVMVSWFGFGLVIAVLALLGVLRVGTSDFVAPAASAATGGSVVVAIAAALASGAVMVTGIEHLAASGSAHAEPRTVRARRTLLYAVVASALAFLAISWLAWEFGVGGWADGPVLLQVTAKVVGGSVAIGVMGVLAVAVLYAASSAVFRRFSMLASVLARDSFLPRQLHTLNDRLVFKSGVLIVAGASALVLIAANANVTDLIHLYIVGVFTSITLGQIAMVRHVTAKLGVTKAGPERTRRHLQRVLHVSAALVAGFVLLMVVAFEFFQGAWIAIGMVMGLIVLMLRIRTHYVSVRRELEPTENDPASALPSATYGIVLMAQVNRPALRAIAYAKAARHSRLEVVDVMINRPATLALQRRWGTMELGVPLVVLESPYRELVGPIIDYVKGIRTASPRDVVVVYVPEYVVGNWWQGLLHNKSAQRLRARLRDIPGVVVTAVPWHLESARKRTPEGSSEMEE